MVADSHLFDEEQDPDSDPRIEVKIWIRIHIEVKSWIQIRIRIKVMQILNPG